MILLQIKSDLLCTESSAITYKQQQQYYNSLGANTEDFLEIPTWMAMVYHQLKDSGIPMKVVVLQSLDNIKEVVEYVCFLLERTIAISVMDSNKEIYHKIIKQLPNNKFLVGGYCTEEFKQYENTFIFNDISELSIWYDISPKPASVDYELFKGYKTVPRLQLSTGCSHNCKFCLIPNEVKEVLTLNILNQVMAFEKLDFTHVYIDDKTFGQADNYSILSTLYDIIKMYNKSFEGFVVQTTTSMFLGKIAKQAKALHIKVVELGIETVNTDILEKYNKPSTEELIIQSFISAKRYDIKIVPNILVGLPEETIHTYVQTFTRLRIWKQVIKFINIYPLAVYTDTELAKEIQTDSDSNECTLNKTYLSDEQNKLAKNFFNMLVKLNEELLNAERNN